LQLPISDLTWDQFIYKRPRHRVVWLWT
jgi:hypothetical protein